MWCHHPCQCDICFFMPLPSPSAGRYLVFTGGVRMRNYTHRYQFNIATFLVGAVFVSTISQLDLSRTNSKSEHSVEKGASIWNRPTMKELYHIYFEACWRSDTKRFNQNMKIFVRVFFRVLLLLVLVLLCCTTSSIFFEAWANTKLGFRMVEANVVDLMLHRCYCWCFSRAQMLCPQKTLLDT